MKGIQLTGHGDFDKLVLRNEIPAPNPGPRDVLVKVSAAGVNNTDLNTRKGWYSKNDNQTGWSGSPIAFPRIQGVDVCGQVIPVGDAADQNLINQRVLTEPCLFEANRRCSTTI